MFSVWSGPAYGLQTPIPNAGPWARTRRVLRAACGLEDWHVLLGVQLGRGGRRADAVILLPGCIVVCAVREGRRHRDRDVVEDAALDLHDFHAGSRAHPVVPLLVTLDAPRTPVARPLLFPGVTGVVATNAAEAGSWLRDLAAAAGPSLDPAAWCAAPYRPVPGLIEAACTLYARHGVAEIAQAGADPARLDAARAAIAAAIASAVGPTIVFVTGVPGAGKTLCGLDVTFGSAAPGPAGGLSAPGRVFLTGNPSLVHVLREALARDSAATRGALRAARQRMQGVIQSLPAFRDSYAASGVPPERVIVVDEAQRCWTESHAVAKTALARVRLAQSEPAILLDAMARRDDNPVIICLAGGGQEIHDGEGGLAAWGAALRERPVWRVHAPPLPDITPSRQRLSAPAMQDPALHLPLAVRALRCHQAPAWVDAVLADDPAAAARLAQASTIPFTVVRDLAVLRQRLRQACRGTRRCGLLASSGARRLRAEGLGATLPHDDPPAVTRWFLDRFPDIRASDALEVAASEFFCQGLELDYAGLCWDGDLVRFGPAWQARAFRGTGWTRLSAAKSANRLNAYRVLLTRARTQTFIWVPRGEAADPTRDPASLDAIAAYLLSCGARPDTDGPRDPTPEPAAASIPACHAHKDLFAP